MSTTIKTRIIQKHAKEAESLLGYDISTILNSNDSEIPTSKAVLDAIDNKNYVTIKTWTLSDVGDA